MLDIFNYANCVQFRSRGVHSHVSLSIVENKSLILFVFLRRSHLHLHHPQLLAFLAVKHRYLSNWVLVRHQRRQHIQLTLSINIQQKFIKLMLSYFETINHRTIVNPNIKHPSIWVQKSSDIFHNCRSNVIVHNISVIFKLMISVLNNRQFLTIIEVVIGSVPVLLWFRSIGN